MLVYMKCDQNLLRQLNLAKLDKLYDKIMFSHLDCCLDESQLIFDTFYIAVFDITKMSNFDKNVTFSFFLNWNFIPIARFEEMEGLKRIYMISILLSNKKSRWNMLNAKRTIQKKINILLSIHFFFGTYSFILNTFDHINFYNIMKAHHWEIFKRAIYLKCLWCNCCCHWRMDMVTQVQILDKAVCISHSANTLGKGMNLIILLPAMGK